MIAAESLLDHCSPKFPAPVRVVTERAGEWIVATSGQHIVALRPWLVIGGESIVATDERLFGLPCLADAPGKKEVDLSSLRTFAGPVAGPQECEECDGLGTQLCEACNGDGRLECGFCEGEAVLDTGPCAYCRVDDEPTGRAPCDKCKGAGTHTCPECEGEGPFVPIRPGWVLGHAFDLNLIAKTLSVCTHRIAAIGWSSLSQALAIYPIMPEAGLQFAIRLIVMPCEATDGIWGTVAPQWGAPMEGGLICASRDTYLAKRGFLAQSFGRRG